MRSANDFIEQLKLEKHVEGGCFKRVYESKNKVLLPGDTEKRFMATAIYFLLEGQDFSAFHRLRSDEIWSFNYGSPITIYIIDEHGKLETITLGDINRPVYQVTIFAGQWFAAEVNDKSSFSLLSCFVSPGFEYSDFELADRETLAVQYPAYAELISRLTQ